MDAVSSYVWPDDVILGFVSEGWGIQRSYGPEKIAALYDKVLTAFLWLNLLVFARKIRVEYEAEGQPLPCPLKWLDNFSMRNFTNASVFDDTLPVADGAMEIGSKVPLDQLKEAMEDWFRRKSYLPKGSKLLLRVEE